jgi:hypothetical protein
MPQVWRRQTLWISLFMSPMFMTIQRPHLSRIYHIDSNVWWDGVVLPNYTQSTSPNVARQRNVCLSLFPYVVVYIKWASLQGRHLPGRKLQQLLFTFDERKMIRKRGGQGWHAHTNGYRWDRENFDMSIFERNKENPFVKSIKILVSWCEETEEKSFGSSINHGIHRDEVRNQILLFFLRLLVWNDWRLLTLTTLTTLTLLRLLPIRNIRRCCVIWSFLLKT